MNELETLAVDFFSAQRSVLGAQQRLSAVVRSIIDAAKRVRIGERTVLVVDGRLAVYIDPPGTAGNAEWVVTWGSPPVEVTP